MIFPKPLTTGARVALVAPSGAQPQDRMEATLASVRALGLEPVVYPSCRQQHGYFAGADAVRAADINAAFADSSIEAVICIRGGYGAHRLIHLIDFDNIRRNPKLLCGYSDVTALHTQLQQQCGLISMHTPMPGTEWYSGMDDYSTEYLRASLFGGFPRFFANPTGTPLLTLSGGKAEGRLCGGNLTLLANTLGTEYEIDTRGKILFIEEVDEEVYCIDRMLLHLKHAGKLRDCAGILLGYFTNSEPQKRKVSLTLEAVLAELLYNEGKPIISAISCGHQLPTMSLPLGALIRMNADNGIIELLEEY